MVAHRVSRGVEVAEGPLSGERAPLEKSLSPLPGFESFHRFPTADAEGYNIFSNAPPSGAAPQLELVLAPSRY